MTAFIMEFRDICKLFGSQSHVAEILGVSDRTIRRWVKENKFEKWVIKKLLEHNHKSRQALEAVLIFKFIAKE